MISATNLLVETGQEGIRRASKGAEHGSRYARTFRLLHTNYG
jgi:hypothetical protein